MKFIKMSQKKKYVNIIDEESKSISEDLAHIVSLNTEKLTKLNNLSNEIKNSAMEG